MDGDGTKMLSARDVMEKTTLPYPFAIAAEEEINP